MAQLIQMRQRIRTIETIKKVTHAMRLIAMSSHGRLKQKQPFLKNYCDNIDILFERVRTQAPLWQNSLLIPSTTNNHLVILVGSQKGLCGNFNSSLFDFFKKNIPTEHNRTIITVGKKATDFITNKMNSQPYFSFSQLTARNYLQVGRQIITFLKNASQPYSSVTIFSNVAKSFFTQSPHITHLIPIKNDPSCDGAKKGNVLLEQSVTDILDVLSDHYLAAHLQYVLYESLLAEQAARFVSMDNSTRNANNLLESTKLQYNKLRQAKITKELIELTGSLR